jgi:hypothetical protein
MYTISMALYAHKMLSINPTAAKPIIDNIREIQSGDHTHTQEQ